MTFRTLLDLSQFSVERCRQNLYAMPVRDIAPFLFANTQDRLKLLNIMAFQVQIQNGAGLKSQSWVEWENAIGQVGVATQDVHEVLNYFKTQGSKNNQKNIAHFSLIFSALLNDPTIAQPYQTLQAQQFKMHPFSLELLKKWYNLAATEDFLKIVIKIPLVDPSWSGILKDIPTYTVSNFLKQNALSGKELHELYCSYAQYGATETSKLIQEFYSSNALERYKNMDFYHHPSMGRSKGQDYCAIEELYYQEEDVRKRRLNFTGMDSFLGNIPEYHRSKIAIEVLDRIPVDDAVYLMSEAAKNPSVFQKYVDTKNYTSSIQKILRAVLYITSGKKLTEHTVDQLFGFTTPQELMTLPGAALQEKFDHAMGLHCGKDLWEYLNSTAHFLASFENSEMILPRLLELSTNTIRTLVLPTLDDFTY